MRFKGSFILIPLLSLCLGLYLIIFRVTGSDFAYFPGDLGDARFNTYLLEHAHKYFSGEQERFWDAPFMYPAEEVISISDNLLGAAPFYSLFRIFGADRETAFQGWFVLMFALAFLCAYLFFHWCFKNQYAAALGALIFAFSMAMQSQMTHAQVFPRFPVPLAFWAAFLFVPKLEPRYFFAAVMVVVYQFYCGIYLGFMLCVPIGILFLWIIYQHRKPLREKLNDRSWMLKIAGSGILGILTMLPLMLPYLRRAQAGSLHRYADVVKTLPTVTSHFFAKNGTLLWSSLQESGVHLPSFWGHQIFAGAVATLALLFFWNRVLFRKSENNPLVIGMAITGVITFLCFLRIGNLSLYRFIHEVPGFGSMRALGRIINIELIFFGFAVSYFASLIMSKYPKYKYFLLVAATGLILLDNYHREGSAYRTLKSEAQLRVNTLADKMKGFEPNTIVSYEPIKQEDSYNLYQLDAMMATQQLNLRAVNGYSGDAPQGFGVYWQKMDSTSRNKWLELRGVDRDSVYVVK